MYMDFFSGYRETNKLNTSVIFFFTLVRYRMIYNFYQINVLVKKETKQITKLFLG